MKKLIVLLFCVNSLWSQIFLQKVDYDMKIDIDVDHFRYSGIQHITYHNNSNEDLHKLYFHLYPNAFQPGSEMDYAVQNTPDPDARMMVDFGSEAKPDLHSKIAYLRKEDQGFIHVNSIKIDGKFLKFHVEGTILEVSLFTPIKSHHSQKIEVEFEAQVPQQIRRSGKNNNEGVALSMTQWYPKLAAYDEFGWHANPYIGGEFYADWGDYKVSISIAKNYILGGSGYLENANEIGYGYEDEGVKVHQKIVDGKLEWKFNAPNVHDFSWAADPDFEHVKHMVRNNLTTHFLFKKSLSKACLTSWRTLPKVVDEMFAYYESHIGPYPYRQYSVIQGGDGGMEYAMCTLITGNRNERSLIGVVAHELAHSWFQFLLATNETQHAWMDEGFTTYMSSQFEKKWFQDPNVFQRIYENYYKLVGYGIEQPLTTFADCFHYNYGYGVSTYNKGALFLNQLKYIIGKDAFDKTLKLYYQTYVFKHPKPTDFIRCAELVSDMELDWYFNYWIQTIENIDYGVTVEDENKVKITRIGKMPMPLEVEITYEDNVVQQFYIPLVIMRGKKEMVSNTILPDANWTNPVYFFTTNSAIKKVIINPTLEMADIKSENNSWKKP